MAIEEITGRIAKDLESLKQFTATPGDGCTRLPFTPEARGAVNYLKQIMGEAGLEVRRCCRQCDRSDEGNGSGSAVRYDGIPF